MARILVIDDSPTVAITLSKALASDGHEVQGLASFVDLPARLFDDPPDVILLDLVMPAMSGEDVGPFIRRYQVRDTPVLIHSSRSHDAMEAAARQVGAVGVIEKGGSNEELRRVITAALAGAA